MTEQVYTRFEVDFIKRFWIIVEAPAAEARKDAYNVLSAKYGCSARIVKQGEVLAALPAGVEPVKSADWAWLQFHKEQTNVS